MSTIRVPEAKSAVPAADTAPSMPQPQIGDPGPLGLAGFAMTTFVLSVFNAKLMDAKLTDVVLPLALFYGGGVQLLAGMWDFRKGNTFGGLAFSSYGAFWMSFYWYVHTVAGKLPAADAHSATGLYLLGWLVFTTYMTVAAMKTNGAVFAVFAALALTYLFLCIGAFSDTTNVTRVGGYLGLITAALAWYASFAGVTNSTWGRTILPTYPMAQVNLLRPRRTMAHASTPATPVA